MNDHGRDPENGAHGRVAAELVATPLGGDRADGPQDYARAVRADSDVPRLRINPKVGANGTDEHRRVGLRPAEKP